MKRRNRLMIGVTFLSIFLTGCNIFGGGSTSNSSSVESKPYEYSAEDIKYYTEAGEKITVSSNSKIKRTYYKAFDGYCAVAIANIGDYFGPVLVGEDPVQVCYTQDYNSNITEYGGTVTVGDKTYYYSKSEYFLSGHLDGTKDYGNYFSKYESIEDVAKDVASQAAFAKVSDSIKKEFTFSNLDDGTVSVAAGPYARGKEELIIPSAHEGKNVSRIDSKSFQNLTSLKYLKFESNSRIKSIGSSAFSGCVQLSYVAIPESVTSIGSKAFFGCSTDLMIYCEAESKPSGYYESYPSSDYWSGSANQVWYGVVDYLITADYSFGVKIDNTLVLTKRFDDVDEIVVPKIIGDKTVTQIGKYSFYNLKRLVKISLPSSLTSIGTYAFSGCSLLEEVHIPAGVTTIGSNAFSNCSSLKFAVIPDSVKTIGSKAFYGCSTVLMIYCEAESKPSGYYESYPSSDYWSGSANQVWYGVTDYIVAGDYTFGIMINDDLIITKYNGSNNYVNIPVSYEGRKIAAIGKHAFSGKNRIKGISFPSSLTSIGPYAFSGCSLLEEVHIPAGVTTIGSNAFSNCSSLKFAVIPDSVKTIGSKAFFGCSTDLMIYCEAESKPSGYYESYPSSDYWSGSANQVWYGIKDYFVTDNFVFGIKNDDTLSVSRYIGEGFDVLIPSVENNYVITSIGTNAFKGKNKIKMVSIPDTVFAIRDSAFSGCTLLESVNIPNGVTDIGSSAFNGCSSLTTIVIPASVTKIGSRAFSGCSNLTIYCEVTTKPSGYYESYPSSDYWRGSCEVYYGNEWEYDEDGSPILK